MIKTHAPLTLVILKKDVSTHLKFVMIIILVLLIDVLQVAVNSCMHVDLKIDVLFPNVLQKDVFLNLKTVMTEINVPSTVAILNVDAKTN
jgi:hypothetical protein